MGLTAVRHSKCHRRMCTSHLRIPLQARRIPYPIPIPNPSPYPYPYHKPDSSPNPNPNPKHHLNLSTHPTQHLNPYPDPEPYPNKPLNVICVGKTMYKGNLIKRPKGIPYLVDCNVKGFDAGTTNIPCFPLKTLWEHSLFPAIKSLIAPDGACAGAQVIIQEDNAGPHKEARCTTWMTETFADLGWKIELQAPQGKTFIALFYTDCIRNHYLSLLSCCTGPYTNVLDLYIFPSMSHHHSALLQLYNNTEANKEQTWKTIETVWKDTSSSEVSRAFVKQAVAVPWDSTLRCAPGL